MAEGALGEVNLFVMDCFSLGFFYGLTFTSVLSWSSVTGAYLTHYVKSLTSFYSHLCASALLAMDLASELWPVGVVP